MKEPRRNKYDKMLDVPKRNLDEYIKKCAIVLVLTSEERYSTKDILLDI